MRRTERGFTLIELLVVVTIIGVLASIAIPVFLGQRQKAYRSVMAADLRALVTSQTAWSTDNDGFTDDLTALAAEGFRRSRSITAEVRLVDESYLACTKHTGSTYWLVFDGATSQTSESASCA